MKMRKDWKKKNRMRTRKQTTEQGEETGTLKGTTLKCGICLYEAFSYWTEQPEAEEPKKIEMKTG